MSQQVNEPVPSPLKAQGIYGYRTGAQLTTAGKAGVIFPSEARITGTYNSDEMFNPTARGVRLNLVIDPTGPATGTYAMVVQVPDMVSGGVWKTLFGTLATGVTGNGTGAVSGAFLTVYPGLTGIADAGAANGPVTINQHLGPRWRVQVITTLDTLTFTVGGNYLL